MYASLNSIVSLIVSLGHLPPRRHSFLIISVLIVSLLPLTNVFILGCPCCLAAPWPPRLLPGCSLAVSWPSSMLLLLLLVLLRVVVVVADDVLFAVAVHIATT